MIIFNLIFNLLIFTKKILKGIILEILDSIKFVGRIICETSRLFYLRVKVKFNVRVTLFIIIISFYFLIVQLNCKRKHFQ